MTGLAQNEMKAKHGMPLLVRSMEGLGVNTGSLGCIFTGLPEFGDRKSVV